ncbi:MAG TPA: methionine ABC transporter permease [Tissierellaceae bacterium]|nr:methionine ABC transporter permease [Tissierellaceae bacterium]
MAELFVTATLETLYMVLASTIAALLIGLPLGVLVFITEDNNIWPNAWINRILGGIINIFRSIPFIILMTVLFPFTKLVVGKKIGVTATIVPLTVAAAPFIARIIESSLNEIDKGVIESSLAMGASVKEIIKMVLIPESLPAIISGITLTIINLIGYSAMAGAIGGGGLGDVAIRFGLYRYEVDVMIMALVVIILLVQGTQYIGNRLVGKIDKR